MADFIQKLIDNIPDYQQFLTVDEMDETLNGWRRNFLELSRFSKLENRVRDIRSTV